MKSDTTVQLPACSRQGADAKGAPVIEKVIELKPIRSDGEWADLIRASWRESAEAILETGRVLIEAKEAISHGGFEIMVQDRLPFSMRTAQQLMQIARNPALSNPQHAALLPPSWSTLAELSRWPAEEIDLGLKDECFIRSDLKREQLPHLRKRIRSKLGHRVRRSKGRAEDDADAERSRLPRAMRRPRCPLEAAKRAFEALDEKQRNEFMLWIADPLETPQSIVEGEQPTLARMVEAAE